MGDRGTIEFRDGSTVIAAIYTHWHGSTLDQVWKAFCDEQDRRIHEQQVQYESLRNNDAYAPHPDHPAQDSRYGDASYLAMRFAAFVADDTGLGWGIVPTDGTWREGSDWYVQCNPGERPQIKRV